MARSGNTRPKKDKPPTGSLSPEDYQALIRSQSLTRLSENTRSKGNPKRADTSLGQSFEDWEKDQQAGLSKVPETESLGRKKARADMAFAAGSLHGRSPKIEFRRPSFRQFRAPPLPLTDEVLEVFLDALRQTGRESTAAEAAGTTPSRIRELRKKDKIFDERASDARSGWVDEVLVRSAITRATEGVSRPIIGGFNKDRVVATEKVYSDGLLKSLLEANDPRFRKAEDQNPVTGGVLIIPAPPVSADTWQSQFQELATGDVVEDPPVKADAPTKAT